jgi:hypothetical protein
MRYKGNGKYCITIKGQEIDDVTISDLRGLFNSLDEKLKYELVNNFKREYKNGKFSFKDFEDFITSKKKYTGNLNTQFVKDIYTYLNKEVPISKKKLQRLLRKNLINL